MGNEGCVSRAGSKCDVNSMVLSRREGGRAEGGGKRRKHRKQRSQGGGSGANAVESTLVPDRHCQAPLLPQSPPSACESNRGVSWVPGITQEKLPSKSMRLPALQGRKGCKNKLLCAAC